jgi:hypothetical protein
MYQETELSLRTRDRPSDWDKQIPKAQFEGGECMKKIRIICKLLLAMSMVLSVFIVGAYAEEKVPMAPRFTDNANGTVTDNLTGLIWLKNANSFSVKNWEKAHSACKNLADDGSALTDGSKAGDWRLPSAKEIQSLIDFKNYDPALTSGHPFINIQATYYWTSTTYAGIGTLAWGVIMVNGYVYTNDKRRNYYVWPVRGASPCIF